MASNDHLQRTVNAWASRIVPAILVGLVGYASWVVVDPVVVDYLLRPPQGIPVRSGSGVAVILLHFLLLAPMALTFFRVLHIVVSNPGIVPKPNRDGASKEEGPGNRDDASANYLDRPAVLEGRIPPPAGLDQFEAKDVFECDVDGLPRWCSVCENWKPDRSHHSSELGRCVFKMDHYCPWAGGIISENNFKFFIQFCMYAALFCAFTLIVCSYFTWEYHTRRGRYNYNWIALIVISGLFFLFSFGMTVNSLFFAMINTTTVDNLTRHTRVHHLAVSISQPEPSSRLEGSNSDTNARRGFLTSTNTSMAASQNGNPPPYSTITYPSAGRTYAILQTPTGGNIYRLTSAIANIKTVMGNAWYDWFLPIKLSPCCSHHQLSRTDTERSGLASMYKLGPLVDRMKAEANLQANHPTRDGSTRRRRKRRRRRHRNGTHRGSGSGDNGQETELQQVPGTE